MRRFVAMAERPVERPGYNVSASWLRPMVSVPPRLGFSWADASSMPAPIVVATGPQVNCLPPPSNPLSADHAAATGPHSVGGRQLNAPDGALEKESAVATHESGNVLGQDDAGI